MYRVTDTPARILISAISLYRKLISPMLPSACRFYPTCSEYAHTAIERHGAVKGSWMAIKRLGRCHPFHPGGEDPVR
jgi:putative membrane protein insertion efficiency factor